MHIKILFPNLVPVIFSHSYFRSAEPVLLFFIAIKNKATGLLPLWCWQDVARILQDQIRIGDEQIVEALHAAELKYSEEKKVLTEKLTDVNEKLVSALADITTKDHFIKLHIKVAEEAIIGTTFFSALPLLQCRLLEYSLLTFCGPVYGECWNFSPRWDDILQVGKKQNKKPPSTS